ncbi:hypothetical protein CcCBS67573_g07243 [Chytriomyces confervae]|uniref:Borealin N-terminal domain-containing protein n=1 Tax=Chytriomyces confervae TaxID=246404 RepID=A0A507EY45_9FUNG|nr:hypothetical protein CcCBS67573_g07243 [Chytriomyces confervae]
MSKFSSKGGLKTQLLRNLDDETNAVVSSMQRTCDELCASIQQRSDHYIALLPPKLRALSVDLFCTSFAGSVTCFQEREIAEKELSLSSSHFVRDADANRTKKLRSVNDPQTQARDLPASSVSSLLPETPAVRRIRKARPNESLVSINGSPVTAADVTTDGFDPDESLCQNSISMPRRFTIRSGVMTESYGLNELGSGANAMFSIPLDGGETVLAFDPAQSPY